jgi:site-specific recombinase XerD
VNSLELFVSAQNSEATRRAYKYDLNKWTSWLAGRVESVELADEFRSWLEQNHHPRTAARVFNTCRKFYQFIGAFNPFERLKSPRRVSNATPVVPDDSLVDRMVAICDSPRDKMVISLLLNGLRASEVADLTPNDVFWSSEYGIYLIRVVGKGMKERIVPATGEVTSVMQEYLAYVSPEQPFFVLSPKSKRMTMRQVEYVVEKWSEAAGKVIRPHKLRHHYATRLIRADAGVFAVQRLLGHASVATTQVYVTLDLRDVVKEALKDPRSAVTGKKGLRVVA